MEATTRLWSDRALAAGSRPVVWLKRGNGWSPPGGRARDGEPPIEQTTPEIAELAKRFQPTVLVSDTDPFWPVSVGALLEDIGTKASRRVCIVRV
ncbi:MAG TPA: hypothetical protein VGP18_12865 [Solirubrobacteraceae bacterium]|jgi:hypothetical protein|nr:hypothetical protein [Solirubrobacteraceae bacterium]